MEFRSLLRILGVGGILAAGQVQAEFYTATTADETTPVSEATWQQLDAIKATTAQQAVDDLLQRTSLQPGNELISLQSHVDVRGKTHTRVELRYQGLPVANTGVLLHTDIDGSIEQTGAVPDVPPLDTLPTLTVDAIKSIVQLALVDVAIAPDAIDAELQIKLITESRLRAGVTDQATATATDYEDRVIGSRLVYRARVDVVDTTGPHKYIFDIDAHSGEVLLQHDNLDRFTLSTDYLSPTPTTGTTTTFASPTLDPVDDSSLKLGNGRSQYSGLVTVPVTPIDNGQFFALGRSELMPTPKGIIEQRLIDVRSFDAEGWGDLDFDDASEYAADNENFVWGNGANFTLEDAEVSDPTLSAGGQTAAVDALYGASVVWDMWDDVFNHIGLDGNGEHLFKAVVHLAPLPATAKHEETTTAFYDKGIVYFPDPYPDEKQLLSVDIVGHELAHGFYNHTVVFNYDRYGEAGGISEANADIMGTLAEFYASNYPHDSNNTIPDTGGNWTIGEHTQPPGQPVRFMYKPSKDSEYKEPGKHSFDYWFQGMDDASINGHRAAGPVNRMFYFLAMGAEPEWSDPNFDVGSMYLPQGMAGIGVNKAAKIWYHAIRDYLVPPFKFKNLRQACEYAAADLYGDFSVEQKAVQDAFAAIFVGPPADRAPPVITISTSGSRSSHTVHVSLADESVHSGAISVTMKNAYGLEINMGAGFTGNSGSLYLGNVTEHIIKVRVTADDTEGNQSQQTRWLDYQAPVIEDIQCTDPLNHRRILRTCSATVSDGLDVNRLEFEVTDDISGVIYRQPWAGGTDGTAPWTGGDTLCESNCDTTSWPAPVSHRFEFEVDLRNITAPGGHYDVQATVFDNAGNGSSANGRVKLDVDEWPPSLYDMQVSGNAGFIELAASAVDAFGDISISYQVDGVVACTIDGQGWDSDPFVSACSYDSTQLANGTHTYTAKATDRWGNAVTKSMEFSVYNFDDPDPMCSPKYYEVEDNGPGNPNVVPPCTASIIGDYDAVLFGLDKDVYSIRVEAGEKITVSSMSYCGNATLRLVSPAGSGNTYYMNNSLALSMTNTRSYAAEYRIEVFFSASCSGNYVLYTMVQ